MAAVTVQDGSAGYAAASFNAAANSDTVAGGAKEAGWHLPVVLLVKNADATATNVTVGSLPAVSVPATSGVAVIPVVGAPYGAAVPVTYSKLTSLTVAAVRLTSPLE